MTLFALRQDQSGVTIVEFALILPVLCVLLLGTLDLGYRSYATSILQGSLHEAARMATVGGVTMTQIDARVRTRLNHFAGPRATVTITASNYYDHTRITQPEKLLIDTAPFGAYNQGDCWEETTGNTTRDANASRSGLGGADDVVRYRVSLSFPRIFPIGRFLGWSDTDTINAETVLRNQPYAGRPAPPRLQWQLNPNPSPGAWELKTC